MGLKSKIVSSVLIGIAAFFVCAKVFAQDSPLDTSTTKETYMEEYSVGYYYDYHPPSISVCSGCYQVGQRIRRGEVVDLYVNHCIVSQWRRKTFEEGEIITLCFENGQCIEDYEVQEDGERYYYYIWRENYDYC